MAGLMGISMGISWDFMGFHGDFMGFHADFMGISWLCFIGFHGDFMGYATNISDLGLLKSPDDTDEGFRGSHIPIRLLGSLFSDSNTREDVHYFLIN